MGHEVRVVAPSIMKSLALKDQRHIANRKWRLNTVNFCPQGISGRLRSISVRGRRKLAQPLFKASRRPSLADHGYVTALSELTKLAASETADWFIAHAQAALPVAAKAAQKWNAKLGFDCEDLLSEMDSDRSANVLSIERRYLPNCQYVSVPSEAIGHRLVEEHGIAAPVTLYNVFPNKLADGLKPPSARTANRIRFHWFGQTIGEGRGIEEAIVGLNKLSEPTELHLRGFVNDAYCASLKTLAKSSGDLLSVFFHPQIAHDELIQSMGQFDVGLALERPANVAYALTVTNKVFSYLLAGLAVAATDTPGQKEVMDQIPSAGFVYPAGQPEMLARGIQKWLAEPDSLRRTKQGAWGAARERFNWDHEKQRFLNALGISTRAMERIA